MLIANYTFFFQPSLFEALHFVVCLPLFDLIQRLSMNFQFGYLMHLFTLIGSQIYIH